MDEETQKVEAFLTELAALYEKHQMRVTWCCEGGVGSLGSGGSMRVIARMHEDEIFGGPDDSDYRDEVYEYVSGADAEIDTLRRGADLEPRYIQW